MNSDLTKTKLRMAVSFIKLLFLPYLEILLVIGELLTHLYYLLLVRLYLHYCIVTNEVELIIPSDTFFYMITDQIT